MFRELTPEENDVLFHKLSSALQATVRFRNWIRDILPHDSWMALHPSWADLSHELVELQRDVNDALWWEPR